MADNISTSFVQSDYGNRIRRRTVRSTRKFAGCYRTLFALLGAGTVFAGTCQSVGTEVLRFGLNAVVTQLNQPEEDPSFSDWFRGELEDVF